MGGIVDVELLELWFAEVDAGVDAALDAVVLELCVADVGVLESVFAVVVFGVDVEVVAIIYRGLLIYYLHRIMYAFPTIVYIRYIILFFFDRINNMP